MEKHKSKYTKAQRRDFYEKAEHLIVPEMCAFRFACRCLCYVIHGKAGFTDKFNEDFLINFPELMLFNPYYEFIDDCNSFPWWELDNASDLSDDQKAEARRIALLLCAEMCKGN